MKTECGIDVIKISIDIDKNEFVHLSHYDDDSNRYYLATENFDVVLTDEQIKAFIKLYHFFKNLEQNHESITNSTTNSG